MTTKLVAVALLCLVSGTAMAEEAKVTPLMSKDLAEYPGKEALMITVEHAPGGSSAIHRHNAHAFVYVLEGSVVMQLKGGKQVTLTPGQTFYEGPAAPNASNSAAMTIRRTIGAPLSTVVRRRRAATLRRRPGLRHPRQEALSRP